MKASAIIAIYCVVLAGTVMGQSACPEQDDPLLPPVLLPHPTDCDKFLHCSHGHAVVSKCPPGLHWNDVRKQCDYPSQAKCQPEEGEEGSSPAQEQSPYCPDEYDPDHMVYVPHGVDCEKYYICDPYGVALEQVCPSGLHWNPSVNYCDFPELALCE